MSYYDFCPHCKADLTGAAIPYEDRKHYIAGTTHYSRLVAIYDNERDRTVAWMCPDCRMRWGRE